MSKPVITAQERSIVPEPQPGIDLFDVGDYSDKRRERDLAIRRGERAAPLSHRLQWVTTQDLAGKPDKRKEREWIAKGYRRVNASEAASLGIDMSRIAGEKRPDGSIGLNEYTLFVIDAAGAQKELARKEARDDAMQGTYEAKVADAVDAFNREAGLSGRAASQPLFETTGS